MVEDVHGPMRIAVIYNNNKNAKVEDSELNSDNESKDQDGNPSDGFWSKSFV